LITSGINGVLVVASLTEEDVLGPTTKILTFTRKQLLDWYDRAWEFWGEFGGVCAETGRRCEYSWGMAFRESDEAVIAQDKHEYEQAMLREAERRRRELRKPND
jgi:hypothetical protein